MEQIPESNVGEVLQMASTAELIKIIKCPGCGELPIPPIYNCVYGHSICSFCRPKLAKCVLCEEKLTLSRSFLLESIVESSFMKCKFSLHGCPSVLTGSTYRDHIHSCELRPIQCFETSTNICKGEKVNYPEYVKHLQDHHRIEGYDEQHEYYEKTECIPVLKPSLTFPIFYLTFDDKIFLKNARVENSQIHWWISLLGTQKDAEQYGATIILYRRDLENLKVEFKIPIQSFRKTFEELSAQSECASMSIHQLPPFCLMDSTFLNENDRIEYLWEMKYAIWKM